MCLGSDGLTEAAVCRNFEVSHEVILQCFKFLNIVLADADEDFEDGVNLFLFEGLISRVSQVVWGLVLLLPSSWRQPRFFGVGLAKSGLVDSSSIAPSMSMSATRPSRLTMAVPALVGPPACLNHSWSRCVPSLRRGCSSC